MHRIPDRRWLALVGLLLAPGVWAQELTAAPPEALQPPPPPSLVRLNTVGPKFTIAPGVFIPSSGAAGFSLGVEGGYGFDLGPVIVTPGVSFQGNWSSDWTVYSGLGTVRVLFPIGNFGPFVEGGLGYGHASGALGYSQGGLAVRGGAGFIYFFSPQFALGLLVRYDTIIDTGFKGWTFAPTLLFHF
jgi:hypothetical protein